MSWKKVKQDLVMYKALRNDQLAEIQLCFWGGRGVGSERIEKQGKQTAALKKNKLNR